MWYLDMARIEDGSEVWVEEVMFFQWNNGGGCEEGGEILAQTQTQTHTKVYPQIELVSGLVS